MEERAVELAGVKARGRPIAPFIGPAGKCAHEGDLLPRLLLGDRVKARGVNRRSAVACIPGHLPGRQASQVHLIDIPISPRGGLARKQDAFAVNRNVRIAGAAKPGCQDAGPAVRCPHYKPGCRSGIGPRFHGFRIACRLGENNGDFESRGAWLRSGARLPGTARCH